MQPEYRGNPQMQLKKTFPDDSNGKIMLQQTATRKTHLNHVNI